MITRCPECPGTNRCVEGDGPEPCSVLFIGEAPGREEDKGGRPFIGRSGEELNDHYLRLAGLTREDIRLTNTVKCRPPNNRKPSEREVRECGGWHLPGEIMACDPEMIVLMGSTACSLVPSIDLESDHGFPIHNSQLFNWVGTVVPMYHPAAGMHDTAMMTPLIQDFTRLREILRSNWDFRQLPGYISTNTLYRLCDTVEDVIQVLQPSILSRHIAIDTESHGGIPWSIQFSRLPGVAGMILLTNEFTEKAAGGMIRSAMEGFRGVVKRTPGTTFIFHHHPADLPILKNYCDINIPIRAIRDTMQEAYQQQDLPQGLKALARRLTGHKMKSYEDVVRPHSRMKMAEWLCEAMEIAERDLCRTETKQLKTKTKQIIKPGETERALRRILRFTSQNSEYDPWEKVSEYLTQESQIKTDTARSDFDHIQKRLGEPPIMGIAHVPIDEAVQYGCADADYTLRVAHTLEKRARSLMNEWNVSKEDQDET